MAKLVILTFIFCILQISILRSIAILQVIPNLLLILVLYIGLFHGKQASFFGFFGGLFIDLYNISMGWNALVNTMIGYGLGSVAPRLNKETPILWIAVIFVASLFHETISFATQKELSLFFWGRYIIPTSLYTTAMGVIIFMILRRLDYR